MRAPLAIALRCIQARQLAMPTHKLLLLPGDGIGPEVMAEVKKLIAFMNAHGLGTFETEEALVGGSCSRAPKGAIPAPTMAKPHPPHPPPFPPAPAPHLPPTPAA